MIQRQFLDFGGITHSAGGRGRGGVCWFLPRFFFKKKFPHLCFFFDLRGFNYLGLVWFRVCMDGFAAADTAAGRKVDGRQSSSLTPPTTLTISQLPQDIRNENVFALYLPINSLPSFPYPRLPSLARSLRSLSLRLRKAKAQNGGEGVSQSRDCPSRRGGVWIR